MLEFLINNITTEHHGDIACLPHSSDVLVLNLGSKPIMHASKSMHDGLNKDLTQTIVGILV